MIYAHQLLVSIAYYSCSTKDVLAQRNFHATCNKSKTKPVKSAICSTISSIGQYHKWSTCKQPQFNFHYSTSLKPSWRASEQAAFKQLKIANNIADETIIFADNEQAKIILRNILTNAVRYTTNGGKITITTKMKRKHNKKLLWPIQANGMKNNLHLTPPIPNEQALGYFSQKIYSREMEVI